jgi:hypothetical protein
VGYQTLQSKIMLGIKPHGTTFESKYLCKFETEFKNLLGCELGAHMASIHEKTQRSKNLIKVHMN